MIIHDITRLIVLLRVLKRSKSEHLIPNFSFLGIKCSDFFDCTASHQRPAAKKSRTPPREVREKTLSQIIKDQRQAGNDQKQDHTKLCGPFRQTFLEENADTKSKEHERQQTYRSF